MSYVCFLCFVISLWSFCFQQGLYMQGHHPQHHYWSCKRKIVLEGNKQSYLGYYSSLAFTIYLHYNYENKEGNVLFNDTLWKQKHINTRRKEGNVLFNDALNTFYLRLYGVTHTVKGHSDSERGNLLLPHGLLFPISSKGSFICMIPQTG